MSATEWLSFISPIMWTLFVLNLLALLPMKLKKLQPLRVKFTLALFVFVLLGWLMVLLATHIKHHPVIRVIVVQGSQVILTPVLIALGILLVFRLMQRENVLTTLIKQLIKWLKPIGALVMLLAPCIQVFLCSSGKAANDEHEMLYENERSKYHINAHGEYAPHDKINWYF